jgi:hypothetical protein
MTLPASRRAALELLVVSLLIISPVVQAQEINSVWVGPVGNWNDGKKWSTAPDFPNNRRGQTYSAFLNNGDVTLNQAVTVEQLVLGAAGTPTLRGVSNGSRDNSLSVRSDFGLKRGLITDNATVNALGTSSISGNSSMFGSHLVLAGPTNWSGRLGIGNAAVIDNLPGATIYLSANAICDYAPNNLGPSYWKRWLNNYGTINANGGAGVTLDVALNSPGTINVNSGSLVLAAGGTISGPINLANGATLDFENTGIPNGTHYVLTPASSISGIGSVKFNSWSNLLMSGGYDITGTTTVTGLVSFLSPISSLGTSLVVNGQFASCDLSSNSASVGSLYLRSGAVTGNGMITVNGPLEWNEGSMLGGGITNAQQGVFFNGLTGSMGFNILDRTLNCYGSSSVQTTVAYMAYLNFGLNAALNIMPGATFNGSRLGIEGSSSGDRNNGAVTNYGTLVINDSGLNRGMGVFGTAFVNQGIIQITNSKLDVRGWANTPAYLQNAGSLRLQNGTLACDRSTITGGSLSGHGYVGGLVNNGLIAPSGGSLNFSNSSLTLQADSALAYNLNGTMPGVSFGQIVNVSVAALGGELQVTLSEAFQSQIQPSDTFTLLTAQAISGQFANVGSGARLATADGSGSFIVTYTGNSLVLSNFLATNFAR